MYYSYYYKKLNILSWLKLGVKELRLRYEVNVELIHMKGRIAQRRWQEIKPGFIPHDKYYSLKIYACVHLIRFRSEIFNFLFLHSNQRDISE